MAITKVPFALAMSGFVPETMRLLRWVRTHHFTSEGDFRAPSRKATLSVHDDWPTYSNAWLIQGAHRLGQFDLSVRGAEFLLRYQTPCGGFQAFEGGVPYVECVGTSWSGLAELTVGNRESAAAAAKCLKQLVDQQPDPGRFYFRMTREGKLVTNVPAGEALSYYVDAERKKQIYFHPGIAMAFLCHYYLAMDDSAALAAAETIFEFTQRCADDVYCFLPSGELGYSCAVLSAITNRPEARHAAEAVADYLVRTQVDEGYWRLPDDELYAIIEDKNDPEILLDTTAEFCTWLWEISALLP